MTKPFLSKKIDAPLGIPEGFCNAQTAAKMMEVTLKDFKARVLCGVFPQPEIVAVMDEGGHRMRSYYRISKLEKFIPKKPKIHEQELSNEAFEMLARLKARAKKGFVDGEASDLIHGNPIRKKDMDVIAEIVQGGYASFESDNWSRLTYMLSRKKEDTDASIKPY